MGTADSFSCLHQGKKKRPAHEKKTRNAGVTQTMSTSAPDATLEHTFAAFWAVWPKPVKKQAAKDAMRWALHHYDNPPGTLLQAMLDTIAWQLTFYREPRFFPDPNKWILEMRWTDEPPRKIVDRRKVEAEAKHSAAEQQAMDYWRKKHAERAS